MRSLYYTFRTLIRGRGSNVIKIISLTLGIFIGILLFARVAFELSYDSFYKENDKLFAINCTYVINGNVMGPGPVIVAPVAGAILENFPDEVESASVVADWGGTNYFSGSHRINLGTVYSDSLYFQTMGIEVLKGNPADLTNPEVLFLSETTAKQLYGNDNPIGKILMQDKTAPMTVRGVFRDIPENATLRHDAVASFATVKSRFGRYAGWNGDDSYVGYVRFRRAEDAAKVEARLPEMIAKYAPRDAESGFSESYAFLPIRKQHGSNPEVHKMIVIMTILASILLFIAAMNYVLISISSLPRRAKGVGVHKCSGATSGNVFGMFMWETAILIAVSLCLVVVLMINFRNPIEDHVDAHLMSLFTWSNLWLPLSVLALLFVLAGVLPGRLFASVPVSQVFRRYTEKKNSWKKPLLFVQFAGVAFITAFLCIILIQYHQLMNTTLNYNPDNVAVTYLRGITDREKAEMLNDELRRMPVVESVGTSMMDILSGYGGMPVTDGGGKVLFTARWCMYDYNFVPTMQITLTEGKNIDGPDQVLVNETFVGLMHWTDGAVGKQVEGHGGSYGTVVGVMKDFPINSVRYAQSPVLIQGGKTLKAGALYVRTRELTPETLETLNRKIAELFPTENMEFHALTDQIYNQYRDVRRFRDAVVLASIAIGLITLMGLFGYVNDEVRRRSKEIAIRKVNGAEAGNILALLSESIVRTALPAVIIGCLGAYCVGGKWLDQFADAVSPSPLLYAGVALSVLLVIVAGVVLRAWRVANENPVNSIKNE